MKQAMLTYEKQRFIEYVLYQYNFKNPESVWILNLIKSDPKYLNNITFVENSSYDRVLSMSTNYSKQLPLLYCKHTFCIDDGRQIFHDIRLDDSPLNILLYLQPGDYRQQRILLLQMLFKHLDEDILASIYENGAHLNMSHIKDILKQYIDLALDKNDQTNFKNLSQILQFMNALEEKQ